MSFNLDEWKSERTNGPKSMKWETTYNTLNGTLFDHHMPKKNQKRQMLLKAKEKE